MKFKTLKLALAMGVAVPMGLLSTTAFASIAGATYDYNVTGSNSSIAGTLSGSTTAPSGGGFCVGPPTACGSGSGLSVGWSFADVSSTLAELTFNFSGSTYPTSPTFTVDLSNFSAATDGSTITGMSFASGALNSGTFGLTSFSGGSATFTGTPNSSGYYSALGGNQIKFNVAMAPVPVPAAGFLLMGGLAALGALRRRKSKATA